MAKANKTAKVAKTPKRERKAGSPVLSVLAERRASYEITKSEDGRRLIDCGDEIASALRGLDLDGVYAHVAKAIAVPEKELRAKYGHLNVGMQRMNLGNRLRGGKAEPKAPKAKKETAKAPKAKGGKKATKKVTKAPTPEAEPVAQSA